MFNVGIDVGGTFTDFVYLDNTTGELSWRKVPTTPDDLVQGVLDGLADSIPDLDRIIHGTTIATNAILQRRGATVALITTRGLRNQIEIGDTRRYTGGLHDHRWVREKPFMVPHALRFEVTERISHTGEIVEALNTNDLLPIIETLKAQAIKAVAVCFLNSYVNSSHELQAVEFLKQHLPGAWVTYSSLIPEYREYPRFMTAVLNAYVAPILGTYVRQFSDRLGARGYTGEVLYMSSAGGTCSEETSIEAPIRIVGSGVAGGASATAALSQTIQAPRVINFEMGGTSTDVCLVKDHKPTISTGKVIIAFPIIVPEVDVSSIGAGGGSIAWIDPDGSLKVGPQSAGAQPGPACYGRGGTAFTVTDANVLLGRIGPDSLVGGAMHLQPELATRAASQLLEQTNLSDIGQLAEGVLEIATTHMYGAIREITIERGENPAEFSLIASGGAGPLHAIPLAERLGVHSIIVPPAPGTFSAMGMLVSDLRHDFVRTYLKALTEADIDEIKAHYHDMETEAQAALQKDKIELDHISMSYAIDVRYLEQSFVEHIEVPGYDTRLSDIAERFTEAYEKRYGYHREAEMIELVSLRLIGIGQVQKPQVNIPQQPTTGDGVKATREVRFAGQVSACPIYDRAALPQGMTIVGPAIIEEYASTTALHPGWQATVDKFDNLILTPNESD